MEMGDSEIATCVETYCYFLLSNLLCEVMRWGVFNMRLFAQIFFFLWLGLAFGLELGLALGLVRLKDDAAFGVGEAV